MNPSIETTSLRRWSLDYVDESGDDCRVVIEEEPDHPSVQFYLKRGHESMGQGTLTIKDFDALTAVFLAAKAELQEGGAL